MTIIFIALFLLISPLVVNAAPPEVMTIVKQMKLVHEPVRPSTRQIIITSDGPGGERTQWVAGQAYKMLPEGKRLVTVILSPESLKGSALLIHEREGKASAMWMYFPPLRRIRQIPPVDIYQRFLDTDFTYADLGFFRLEASYRLLGEEPHNGVRAYKVEEAIPQDRAYYSRIITWVAVD